MRLSEKCARFLTVPKLDDPALEYARVILDQAAQMREIEYRSAIFRVAERVSFADVCRLGRSTAQTFLDVVTAGIE